MTKRKAKDLHEEIAKSMSVLNEVTQAILKATEKVQEVAGNLTACYGLAEELHNGLSKEDNAIIEGINNELAGNDKTKNDMGGSIDGSNSDPSHPSTVGDSHPDPGAD